MIVTVCADERFRDWIQAWREALTLSGHLVFDEVVLSERADAYKTTCDKIMLSNAFVCLNVYAFMGPQTLAFVDFAEKHRKPVYFLESWGKGCGIGGNHKESVQRLKTQGLGIPADYMSPIDTTTWGKYPFDLLPPAGILRSRLVRLLKEPERRAYREWNATYGIGYEIDMLEKGKVL